MDEDGLKLDELLLNNSSSKSPGHPAAGSQVVVRWENLHVLLQKILKCIIILKNLMKEAERGWWIASLEKVFSNRNKMSLRIFTVIGQSDLLQFLCLAVKMRYRMNTDVVSHYRRLLQRIQTMTATSVVSVYPVVSFH